jgi:hypothetical protein
MDATGGYDTPHAVLTLAIAAGVGVGALCIGAAWEARRYGLALAIITAVVAGEVYGFVLTAERLITAREQAQAPLRASKAERAEAAKRLSTAEAAKRDADAAVVQKAAEKGCRENCSKLLQGQVDAAALEVQKARAATDTKKPLASPTPLADRLGVPAWIVDVVTAALGSIAANGLGCCLLAFAGHRRRPSVIPKVDTVDVERVEVVTASAPDLLRKHANRFAMDCLRPSDARARLVDIHRAYAPWCRLHGEEQRQEAQIGATLAALFREAEIPSRRSTATWLPLACL